MKRKLYILAPNDRFNYGDLLFPYIIRHYLGDNFDDIIYCSTSESDLSERGGIKTKDSKELYNLDLTYNNYLIVAGGESLCSPWIDILSFINPQVMKFKKILSLIPRLTNLPSIQSIINYSLCKIFDLRTKYPFSVGKNELSDFSSIVYNSLGGISLLHNQKLNDRDTLKILKSVDYISVRDNDTHEALSKAGIKHFVSPDCAILMSNVFDDAVLKGKLTTSVLSLVNTEKYLFFQVGLKYAKNNIRELAHQLQSICANHDIKICLCPIGTALGHSDQIALNTISEILSPQSSFVIYNPNIFDIMYLISHSKVYVGSSLHGTITAMSFNVPYCPFGAQKINSYMKQWVKNNSSSERIGIFSEISSISRNVSLLLDNNIKVDMNSYQKKEAIKSFERIKKLWFNNENHESLK